MTFDIFEPMRSFLIFSVLLLSGVARAQTATPTEAELKSQILQLQGRVENIEVNLGQAQRKFQTGMALATIGYTVTIAGGLMLGRENDQLGQGLLVVGGATGIVGTFMLVDSFKHLGRAAGLQRKRKR
jgi:hypothetical protein